MSNETKKKSQSQFMDTFRRLCRNKSAVLGLIIVIALALIALLAPVVYDYDAQIIKTNYGEALQAPSAAHWFGTDEMGRDIFNRVMYGSTTSLSIGLVTVIVALTGGLILGAVFMATDYATTPITRTGKMIFAFGCGLITFLIRYYGAYPEGVSFAILFMNILSPYIEKWTKKMALGGKKA